MVGKQTNGKDTNHFTMNIWYIAPKQNAKNRKHKRITKANDALVREIIEARSADYRQKIPVKENLRLSIPKFSVSTAVDMKSQLMKMGIKQVFEGGADFSPIFGNMENLDVIVKSVNHKVQLDVDENGIEGSAATAMALAFRSGMPAKRLDINSAFYFSVTNREYDFGLDDDRKSGNVPIFVGKIVTP